MAELVKSTDVLDIVIDVTREQIAREKSFINTLAKVLDVLPEYRVSLILSLVH